jgi:hypothetical protein
MTRLARIFLGVLSLPLPAFAQNAPPAPLPVEVTFYSSGKTFMMLPGSRAAFVGKVFDEDHELALLKTPLRYLQSDIWDPRIIL